MKTKQGDCDLGTCFLCRFCHTAWKDLIAVRRQTLVLKKGEKLFAEGEAASRLYFLYEGTAKVHMRWNDDKDLILRFAKKGDMLGYMGIGVQNTYPVSATMIEDGSVCWVELDFFESTLKVNHQLAIFLVNFFATELQIHEKRMRNLAHMPVKERIAQAMVSLQDQFGTSEDGFIALPISRQDLSSYAGVAYETFFKIAQEFSQQSLLELQSKRIKILNTNALNSIIETKFKG